MKAIFNEFLDLKELVKQLFEKEKEINKLDYDPFKVDNSEWVKKVNKLQAEIKEMKSLILKQL